MLGKSLDEKSNEIMECNLDNAVAEVAIPIAGYIYKKLIYCWHKIKIKSWYICKKSRKSKRI